MNRAENCNHTVFWRFVVMIMIAGNPNQPEMKSEAQGMFSDRWDIKVADDVFFFTCPLFIFSPCKWVSFSCSIRYPLMFSDPWNLPFCFFSFIDDSFLHPAFFHVSASLDYFLLKHSYSFPKQPLHLLHYSFIYDWFNKPCLSVSICAKQAPAGVFHLHITILIFGLPE